MAACANSQLDDYLAKLVKNDDQHNMTQLKNEDQYEESVEDRLSRLLRQRNQNFQTQMNNTLNSWHNSI